MLPAPGGASCAPACAAPNRARMPGKIIAAPQGQQAGLGGTIKVTDDRAIGRPRCLARIPDDLERALESRCRIGVAMLGESKVAQRLCRLPENVGCVGLQESSASP